ncbi:MAG TPA: hypothetical protein VHF07_08195 [Nitrospiraceae bacterium]|nr:hypothetical protein [Nitrospiraceae bacterium]
MPRFRRYRRAGPRLADRLLGARGMRRLLAPRPLTDSEHTRWEMLHRECVDGGSRGRLSRLIHRLGSRDRGVQESALAELELATLLIRAGVSLRFLPESQARSADLECHAGDERFFVEVTAMVGAAERSKALSLRSPMAPRSDDEEPETPGHLLMNAILARVRQKAKQLADYCDPVLLAISVPGLDERMPRRSHEAVELDIMQLIGWLTLLLPELPHLSGVLLTLWDIEPIPLKSGIRLGNVLMVERSRHQQAYPRVRLLVLNPSADSPLRAGGTEAMRQLL